MEIYTLYRYIMQWKQMDANNDAASIFSVGVFIHKLMIYQSIYESVEALKQRYSDSAIHNCIQHLLDILLGRLLCPRSHHFSVELLPDKCIQRKEF